MPMKKPSLGILVKPVSGDCNMACDYCYYRPARALYADVRAPRMALQTAEAVCEQYLALGPARANIGWQGGEPTLMGLDFFRQVVEIERRHTRGDAVPANTLQTNGVALDDEWCRFLAGNDFLVGLSVDGPSELNARRRFANGKPAFGAAMRAMGLLKSYDAEFNVLVVISQANVQRPHRLFDFLVENDLHYAQVIPCTEPGASAGTVSEHSVTAAQYGDFMIALFEAWLENDDPSYYVRSIDNWLHLFFGLPAESCTHRQDCRNLLTIEWNGDVYPCDFFVEDRYRLGNVREETLEQMLRGPAFRQFVREAESVPKPCTGCEWLRYCHAGCYRHRRKLGIGDDQRPYLCEGDKRIFGHVFGRLRETMDDPARPRLHAFLTHLGQAVAARLAQPLEGQPGPPPAPAGAQTEGGVDLGRNDPCPCGSGRKRKHCCGRVAQASYGG
jgi:uncharacterized protein